MKNTKGRTGIYKGLVERRVLLEEGKGYVLPEKRAGRLAALELLGTEFDCVYMPGTRQYTFGTALMLEAGVLPTDKEEHLKKSDWICIAQAYEQPEVYRTYFGNTYKKNVPEIPRITLDKLRTELKEINNKYGLQDNVLAQDIEALNSDPKAWDRIWDTVYNDREKYHGIELILLDKELDYQRAQAAKIFTAGSAHVDELDRVFDKTRERIMKLDISDKKKDAMLKELDALRENCCKELDPVTHLINFDTWNKAMLQVHKDDFGAERNKFTDILSEELAKVTWKKAEPDTIYIRKEELREYFNRLNETTPYYMRDSNERIYAELQRQIDKDQNEGQYIHTPEQPYKPITEEELDNLTPERNPMPVMLLHTVTCSNDQADKHEAFVTFTDGVNSYCDKVIGDSDGGLSTSHAEISMSGAIADIDAAADRDVSNERFEEQNAARTAQEEPVATKVVQEVQEPRYHEPVNIFGDNDGPSL